MDVDRSQALLRHESYKSEILEKAVSGLLRRVSALEGSKRRSSVPIDPIEQWRMNHAGEIAKHSGKRIAIHPQRGIVASSATFSDVVREVKRQGLEAEVVIQRVPVR